MLIALSLIGIITLLLFSGLRLGSRSWETVDGASERIADLRIARNLIQRTIREARKLSIMVDGVETPVFSGTADALEWVAPLSDHIGIPGLYILRLTLEDAGDYPRLVLTRWLMHPDVLEGSGEIPAWEPLADAGGVPGDAGPFDVDVAGGAYGRTVLLPQVESFALGYFGQDAGAFVTADGAAREWLEEWVDQTELPELVGLSLTTPGQSWPTTLIPLPGPRMMATDAL
jgi:general secretion pathway protein J